VHRYVEDGRNPDIYTREFVEIVAKQNQFLNGKMRAFGDFKDVLAEQINTTFPELRGDVEHVLWATSGNYRPQLEEAHRPSDGASNSNGPSKA